MDDKAGESREGRKGESKEAVFMVGRLEGG